MKSTTLAWVIFTNPVAAFAELRDRPRFWWPLIVVTVAPVVLLFWYYSVVDIDWFRDQLMSGNPGLARLPEADRAKALQSISRNTLLWPSVIGALIALPAMLAVQSLYFLVAGRMTRVRQTFRHWFALACWSILPSLLGVVAGLAALAVAGHNSQIGPSEMQPLSLNELIFHRQMNEPGFSLWCSLTIPSLWIWALTIIGVHSWSERSWLFSAVFVMLPNALFYGVWGAIAFHQ